MPRRTEIHHWFVSVQFPRQGKLRQRARVTKTFATEAEAKQYAKNLLSERKIYAGTLLGADSQARRMISGKELHRWIWETEI